MCTVHERQYDMARGAWRSRRERGGLGGDEEAGPGGRGAGEVSLVKLQQIFSRLV